MAKGTPGYCKLCDWPHVGELNKKLKENWNAAQVGKWAKDRYGFTFVRQTLYIHKAHITASEDKIVSLAKRAQANPVIRNASNQDFLEAIRDIGFSKAMDNPDIITIDHSLKAVQILEAKKDKASDIILVLAKFVTGLPPAYLVEGEAKEVPYIEDRNYGRAEAQVVSEA